jgi:hypothetical protein
MPPHHPRLIIIIIITTTTAKYNSCLIATINIHTNNKLIWVFLL